MKGKLSQTDKEAIVAALQAGKATQTELAMRHLVSVSAISYNFRKITGSRFKSVNWLSEADKETIVKELQAGKTPKELADKYGVGSSYIGLIYKNLT